ncbi:hypothetical protein [Flectobacillus roseus]|uniref:Uncharacterized protein n=1 Tax=Flectobacillus roseus TaxID=502259 RepID=A0ABT6Y364_9BACT|nr:hypothetical protein [Flectobacillus roseus]MDI9858007.1 hypothetical protein [Flectobacillus roseus]
MEKKEEKSILAKTIRSESFVEKIILLFATAIISGFLIPYVTNEIQRTRLKNEIILQAQSKLLDDASKTLITYETLLADISWFKTSVAYDTARHQKAFEKYSEDAVSLLSQWRVESLKARNLTSPKISADLDSFQMKMFRLQDTPMNQLHKNNGSVTEWEKQHIINIKMLTEANSLVIQLAKDMNITKNSIE